MKSEECGKAYKKPVKCPPAASARADWGAPNQPCPQSVIVNCCTGTGLTPFVLQSPILSLDAPVSMVYAALDTTCQRKPMVNVAFDCMIAHSADSPGTAVSLVFRLKRYCEDGQEVECGTWAHTRSQTAGFDEGSFGFAICEQNLRPDCCRYAVELINIILEEGMNATIAISVPALKIVAAEMCGGGKTDGLPDVDFCAETVGTYGERKAKCHTAVPVCAECEPKRPNPQGTVFHCCTGADLHATNTCPAIPRSLACVTLDTMCLCRPLAVLAFSAVITAAVPLNESLILAFQVKKSCNNGQGISCGTWSTSLNSVTGSESGLTERNVFTFTFCDCLPGSDCCTYTVELLPDTVSDPFTGSFSIATPTVAVMAVDACPR